MCQEEAFKEFLSGEGKPVPIPTLRLRPEGVAYHFLWETPMRLTSFEVAVHPQGNISWVFKSPESYTGGDLPTPELDASGMRCLELTLSAIQENLTTTCKWPALRRKLDEHSSPYARNLSRYLSGMMLSKPNLPCPTIKIRDSGAWADWIFDDPRFEDQCYVSVGVSDSPPEIDVESSVSDICGVLKEPSIAAAILAAALPKVDQWDTLLRVLYDGDEQCTLLQVVLRDVYGSFPPGTLPPPKCSKRRDVNGLFSVAEWVFPPGNVTIIARESVEVRIDRSAIPPESYTYPWSVVPPKELISFLRQATQC